MKIKKQKIVLTFNAPVTLGFIFTCLVVLVINQITFGQSNKLLFMTYHSSLTNPLTYVRFFTHVLGHQGWSHFFGNATYLLLLGPMLEEKYGSNRLIKVIAITAVITALVNYIFFPGVGLCGASGVVFAFILLTSFTGFRNGEIPITFILVVVVFLGQQVYEGVFLNDNVSNMAHIVGGVVGAVGGFIMNKKG